MTLTAAHAVTITNSTLGSGSGLLSIIATAGPMAVAGSGITGAGAVSLAAGAGTLTIDYQDASHTTHSTIAANGGDLSLSSGALMSLLAANLSASGNVTASSGSGLTVGRSDAANTGHHHPPAPAPSASRRSAT